MRKRSEANSEAVNCPDQGSPDSCGHVIKFDHAIDHGVDHAVDNVVDVSCMFESDRVRVGGTGR